VKIHAAYAAAAKHTGQPTVILAHTKKGYGMGTAGQGKMTTHSQKKLDDTDLIEFRNRFNLPLTDEQAMNLEFYKPASDSAEMQYLHAKRAALGGYLPKRQGTDPSSGHLGAICSQGRRQRNEHHHGLRAHAGQFAERRSH
jgi:pyruvate dehydrogenase E1 component